MHFKSAITIDNLDMKASWPGGTSYLAGTHASGFSRKIGVALRWNSLVFYIKVSPGSDAKWWPRKFASGMERPRCRMPLFK